MHACARTILKIKTIQNISFSNSFNQVCAYMCAPFKYFFLELVRDKRTCPANAFHHKIWSSKMISARRRKKSRYVFKEKKCHSYSSSTRSNFFFVTVIIICKTFTKSDFKTLEDSAFKSFFPSAVEKFASLKLNITILSK